MVRIIERTVEQRPRTEPQTPNDQVDAGVEERYLANRQSHPSKANEVGEFDRKVSSASSGGSGHQSKPTKDDRLAESLKRETQIKQDERVTAKPWNFKSSPNSPIMPDGRSARSSTRLSQRVKYVVDEAEPEPLERYSEKHGLGPPWETPVVFPDTGKRTTVQFDDLKLLDEGEWINDTLIEFYIKWLFDKFNPDEGRVYAFGTHFYTSLTTLNKGQRSINYENVKRWTSKVDLFTYDYVIIPINEMSHWYLAVICNLPEVQRKLQVDDANHKAQLLDNVIVLIDSQTNGTLLDGADDNLRLNRSPVVDDEAASRPSTPKTNQSHDRQKLMTPFQSPLKSGAVPGKGQTQSRDALAETKDATIEEKWQDRRNSRGNGSGIFSHVKPASPKTQRVKGKSRPRTYREDTPAIVILDSLNMTRSQTIKRLKDYLVMEGLDKRQLEVEPSVFQGINAKKRNPLAR